MMRRIVTLLVGASLVALMYWIGTNTYWADTQVPMPPKGEAATNPFYAVQRFTEALGARSAWDRTLTVPPADSVIVLSAWQWNLSESRREALERWVESGGRLVVDWSLAGGVEFDRWSGIVREYRETDDAEEPEKAESDDTCARFQEEHDETPSSSSPDATHHWMCDFDTESFLRSTKKARWALRNASGIQAMRVEVGRGSVTVINAGPFRYRKLFDGDHGWLFVAATQLRRGDDVHFVSEDDHPSLLALLWQHGGPVVVLALALVALVLWRGAVRFGPLAAPHHAARRSLAEQIRGTGQFALRHGSGESLHTACVRALEDAAQRRVPGYARLSANERTAALERITGFNRDALAAAIHHAGLRRSHELRNTIALLEAARRQTLIEHTRSSHGTF
jgi:hypothetical protein